MKGAWRLVLGFAASHRVNERCCVTAATSAFISGMCSATETTRSCFSNAASVPTSVQLVPAKTKSTVLGRPWAPPGQATGKRSRQANGRIFRKHCRSEGHIFKTGIFASPCAISGKCGRSATMKKTE